MNSEKKALNYYLELDALEAKWLREEEDNE